MKLLMIITRLCQSAERRFSSTWLYMEAFKIGMGSGG